MAAIRTGAFTAIRFVLLAVAVLVGAASTAQAAPLTLNFSGSLDLSGTDTPFSGSFTWDPAAAPGDIDPPNFAEYDVEAYQLFFDGVEIDTSLGAGMFVVNNADFFGTGNIDAFVFGATVEKDAVNGDKLLVLILSGPAGVLSGLSLPGDYSFLSLLPDRFAGLSLEVPNGGDENDILLGSGSFEASRVPEPATLMLSAVGLAGVVARARRGRQRRDQ